MLKSLLFYLLGFLLLGLVLLGGLNLAEKGLVELAAPEEEKRQALALELQNSNLVVTFAGRKYNLPLPF